MHCLVNLHQTKTITVKSQERIIATVHRKRLSKPIYSKPRIVQRSLSSGHKDFISSDKTTHFDTVVKFFFGWITHVISSKISFSIQHSHSHTF